PLTIGGERYAGGTRCPPSRDTLPGREGRMTAPIARFGVAKGSAKRTPAGGGEAGAGRSGGGPGGCPAPEFRNSFRPPEYPPFRVGPLRPTQAGWKAAADPGYSTTGNQPQNL